MSKKKHHRKDRPSRSKPSKSFQAATEALYNYIILSEIFANVKDKVLLTTMQRVCSTWRDIIVPRLSRYYQVPVPDPRTDAQVIRFNRLLTPHFFPILSKSATLHFVTMSRLWEGAPLDFQESALTMSIANASSGRRQHLAFTHHAASWRDMLVSTPPIYQVQFIDTGAVENDGRRERSEMVHVPDGLRMGQLYDLITSILTRPAKNGVYEVELEWPSDMEINRECMYWRLGTLKTAHHSQLIVRKTGLRMPVTDDYWSEKGRKGYTRRVASYKWLLLSEGFDEEGLIVNPWK